jgi:cytochrome bd-type quinol oxidase subunit 2
MPKLEYLTIMDYIILISYVYAAIPNFLSIYSFQLHKTNKALAEKYEGYEKKYGLPSYIFIILLIIIVNSTNSPEHTSSMFSWASMRQ